MHVRLSSTGQKEAAAAFPASLQGTLHIFSGSWRSSLKDRLPGHAAGTLGICEAASRVQKGNDRKR